MKTFKKDKLLYRAFLNRRYGRSKKLMALESEIDRYLQKFVYLINEYCRLHFGGDPIPSDIVAFCDDVEIIIGVPKRKYSFQLDEETESVVIDDLTSLHTFLISKGSEEIKNAILNFNQVIPWKPPSPNFSFPSTSSLSPLTGSDDNGDNVYPSAE